MQLTHTETASKDLFVNWESAQNSLRLCEKKLSLSIKSSSSISDLNSSYSPSSLDNLAADSTNAQWPVASFVCSYKWITLKRGQNATFEDNSLQDDSWFSVEYCVNNPRGDGYHGAFRIHKKQKCDFRSDWTDNKLYRDQVEARFGPEEFYFILEGPEMMGLNLEQVHLGNCRYEIPFRVEIPGRYRINLMWHRSAYRAVDEHLNVWPLAFMSYPLGDNVYIEIGSKHDTAATWTRIHQGQGLPPCTASFNKAMQFGRWVSQTPNVNFEQIPMPKQRKYIRVFVNATLYDWMPYDCILPRWSELLDRIKKQNAFGTPQPQFEIAGDSHALVMYLGIFEALCETRDLQSKFGWHRSLNESLASCGKPEYKSSYNYLFSSNSGLLCKRLDFIKKSNDENVLKKTYIANFGHHSMGQPFALKKLTDQLDCVVRMLNDIPRRTALIWFDSPVQPARIDDWIRGYKDGRTLIRVIAWNAYARSVFEQYAVWTVPLNRMTLGVYGSFADDAHYPKAIYAEAARVALSSLYSD